MSILAQFKKVKAAIDANDFTALSYVTIKDGWMKATDSRMTIAVQVDLDLDVMIPGAEFEKALTVLGADCKIEQKEQSIVVKVGRRRITINTLLPEDRTDFEPIGEMHSVSADFMQGLRACAPFMSDDYSKMYACTVHVKEGALFATNNVSIVEYKVKACPDIDAGLPEWLVKYMLSRNEKVRMISATSQAICVWFEDLSWIRSSRVSNEMPDMVFKIIDNNPAADIEVTKEWRDSFDTVSKMSNEVVTIGAERMEAGVGQAVLIDEVNTAVEDDTHWNPKFMAPVVKLATHIDLSPYPGACPWRGEGVRGLVIGRR
jgi:hypothetical protein